MQVAEGRGNLPSAPLRVSQCPHRLPSLPRIALRGLRQAHTKFILEARCPGPETKECFRRAFMKFVCFIKAPIVPSLRWDYPSGVIPSAWVKETAALPCRSKLGAAGPGRETGEVRGRPSTQRAQRPGLLGLGPTGSCDQHRLRRARLQRDLPCLSPHAGPISWPAPLVPWPLLLM